MVALWELFWPGPTGLRGREGRLEKPPPKSVKRSAPVRSRLILEFYRVLLDFLGVTAL